MPPIDPVLTVEVPQAPQKTFAEMLSQGVARDGTFVAHPWKLHTTPVSDAELQKALTAGLAVSPFPQKPGENNQQHAAPSSNAGDSYSAPTRAEAAMNLAGALDYTKKHYSDLDADHDGKLSLSELESAMRKAEGTGDHAKLVAVLNNFDDISKSNASPISRLFGTACKSIDMSDINTSRSKAVEFDMVDKDGNSAPEAMHRHELYAANHPDKLPVDDVHEAAAWLRTNIEKTDKSGKKVYDTSGDGALSKTEITTALNKETDPKVRQMLTILGEQYDTLKQKHGLFGTSVFDRKDGITSDYALAGMRVIEQNRNAKDLSDAMLKNNGELFRALDGVKGRAPDGKVTTSDMEAFIDSYKQRLKDGKPASGAYTAENAAVVSEMLSQRGDVSSGLAKLTSIHVQYPAGLVMNDSFRLQDVKNAARI